MGVTVQGGQEVWGLLSDSPQTSEQSQSPAAFSTLQRFTGALWRTTLVVSIFSRNWASLAEEQDRGGSKERHTHTRRNQKINVTKGPPSDPLSQHICGSESLEPSSQEARASLDLPGLSQDNKNKDPLLVLALVAQVLPDL